MLTIYGPRSRRSAYCDQVSRRDFLTIGGMAMGGVSLASVLKAESAVGRAGGTKSGGHRSIINIYLPGGPSHIDMWDPKPEAPAEIRGEFRAIQTNVPGIEVSEMFPKVAAMMDKFAIVRSLADSDGAHDAYQCMTGRKKGPRMPPGGWPAAGAWISKVQGSVNNSIPPHLALMYTTGNRTWGEPSDGGFLGVAHNPFNLLGRTARSTTDSMVLQGITLDRLKDRDQLVRSLDNFRRDADTKGLMESMDVNAQKALGILTTTALADALDLSKEDPRVVARFGSSSEEFQRDGAPPMVENFCVARRLVEAGVPFVTVYDGGWDHHSDLFGALKTRLPSWDQTVAALINDLDSRGLLENTMVIALGEFGRTPTISTLPGQSKPGRDHWANAMSILFAGGGTPGGQVIGATDRQGHSAMERILAPENFVSSVYLKMGIDPDKVYYTPAGRPTHLVSDPTPIRELM